MTTELETDKQSYVIPAQTLRGSRQDMLSTIDQAITGLLALRHLIAGEALALPPTIGAPAADPQERRGASAPASRVAKIFSSLTHRHN